MTPTDGPTRNAMQRGAAQDQRQVASKCELQGSVADMSLSRTRGPALFEQQAATAGWVISDDSAHHDITISFSLATWTCPAHTPTYQMHAHWRPRTRHNSPRPPRATNHPSIALSCFALTKCMQQPTTHSPGDWPLRKTCLPGNRCCSAACRASWTLHGALVFKMPAAVSNLKAHATQHKPTHPSQCLLCRN